MRTIGSILPWYLVLGAAMGAWASADSDNDGVVDARDQCPQSEAGAPVTMRGCAHDSDGDGVPDYRDNCPDSVHVPKVDAWGCALAREITLDGLSFEVNSADLRRGSFAVLDKAAELLRGYSNLRAEVAGHTDSQGSASHNRQLSRKRAETVRAYLVEAGIDAGSLSARGYGESRPVADNRTEAGRAANRRVLLRILEASEVRTEP